MTWAVYLNETPLDSLGIYVEDLSARYGGPSRSFPQLPLPGRQGTVLTADPETQPRTLSLSGSIDPSARTLAARNSAEDQLKALLYRGLIRVVADDDVTAPRQIDGVCTALQVTPVVHPMVTQVSRFAASILCPDPTWYDVTGQLIAFGTTPSAIPTGTAPSGGVIRVAVLGATNVVDPVVSYLNAAGVTLKTLAFTGTLTAGTDYLEIDLDRQTVVEYASGVASNAISWLSTASEFFAIDPMDGDPLSGSYAQLKVTASSGTPTATWAGVRRWL